MLGEAPVALHAAAADGREVVGEGEQPPHQRVATGTGAVSRSSVARSSATRPPVSAALAGDDRRRGVGDGAGELARVLDDGDEALALQAPGQPELVVVDGLAEPDPARHDDRPAAAAMGEQDRADAGVGDDDARALHRRAHVGEGQERLPGAGAVLDARGPVLHDELLPAAERRAPRA